MDVPARQAFVMAVVPADERAAASSVTNVPAQPGVGHDPARSPACCSSTRRSAGRCVIAGVMKISYDLTLLGLYHDVPEEVGARRTPRRTAARQEP